MGAVRVVALFALGPFALGLGGCREASGADSAGEERSLRVEELVTGLEHPWALAFLPGGDMLVTERAGRVRLVRDGALVEEPVPGGPEVWARGQGGLLDIALAPDFGSSRLVYMSYAKPLDGGEATTAVARARLEDDRFHELEDVFVADAAAQSGQHFGSRIVFGPDGMLYVTVGERGQQEPAQDLSNHVGTTVRLHPDGRVPVDNPFVGRGPDVRPEIFSYGHRNSQGMAVHPDTGAIWQTEHGPRGGDELNLVEAGANHGWPVRSEGDHYSGEPIPAYDDDPPYDADPVEGLAPPRVHWTPAIAPAGIAFYTADRFPSWRGHAFVAALAGRHLRRVAFAGGEPTGEQEVLLEGYGERIRDVRDGPDGYLYILTDAERGVLARVVPSGPVGDAGARPESAARRSSSTSSISGPW